jgi:hypothetical protein
MLISFCAPAVFPALTWVSEPGSDAGPTLHDQDASTSIEDRIFARRHRLGVGMSPP